MQEKRTLYLAGKITGDPYYFTKFYNAQKKLEECGFIVVNPALLPAEGFTWEAYMRMSGAMLAECAEVCFLPDWKESKGAKYEFGEAMAQNKPFFFFADWEKAQEETNKYEYTTEKAMLEKLKKAGHDDAFITYSGTSGGTSARKITTGSKVRVKAGAKTYSGGSLASFVYSRDHIVKELSGKRAVITYGGTVVAAVNVDDLTLV